MNSDDKLISVGKLRDFWNAIKTKFATAAQGAKADTALQKTDIISGTLDGTISVDGTNVPVKGLGSAAYMIVGRNLGNVPMNGASLGTTANVPVVTNTRGQLAPHSSGALGTMAFKEASNYATKATTLSGYGITDAYTKTQSDTALTTHKTSGDHDGRYYTESEVDAKINELNSKIGLRSVYVSQTGTYTFQMKPGTLALVITYYGVYPHYCAGNGQITANQLVIQDGENTITSVNGNTVSVYNRHDRNNMAQAIIFFIDP